jgi:hypothetical protein
MESRFALTAILAALCMLADVVSAAAPGRPPSVAFDGNGLMVDGVKPGTGIAWISVVRDRPKDVARVRSFFGTTTVPPSGKVQLPALDAQANGLWFLADVQSGAAVHAAPPALAGTVGEVAVEAAAGRDMVAIIAPVARVLYVRPGRGAWTFIAHDGSPADADGTSNGVVTMALASMTAVRGDAGPPERSEAGDVVLAIDSRWMRMGRAEVTR